MHSLLRQFQRLSLTAENPNGHLVVGVSDLQKLEGLHQNLTLTEQGDLRVAPQYGDQMNIWEAASLGIWITRLKTGWFQGAMEHLLFHAQPIVRLNGGELAGYEALVRSAPPEAFYGAGPLLEAALAHGQIRAFDARARTAAIEQVYPHLPESASLFINFLPSVVYDPAVCLNSTFQACQRTGADLGRLVFEVVESEHFPDLTLLKSILDRYRAEGARVALDDLGGGYTSLSYLEVLKPDIVKLDRTLIREITPDDPRVQLVSALIRYAHDLGVEVIAEGIETLQELQLASELGADYVQGYFLGKPAPQLQSITVQAQAFFTGT
ncbi:hypothetical protein DC3_49360 [Deinococcus cellulosilyticus NBRC 106333 = KACC 11606]|uniref:EAL domain-containing protein n=2 Tax=Deinococcus cellulosilyticus TaxID=401558 RepID=A0A511NAA9_DEIC1|nr:hypothetical protein DC3_49360 [Deinococcus cellulosilyticus NBRC 106333 = KACC 11606]